MNSPIKAPAPCSSSPAFTFNKDAVTDDLASIADWKEDLQSRIRRAQFIFLYADFDVDFSSLQTEVETYKKVCRCLAWRPE